jgi:hypothetical protein
MNVAIEMDTEGYIDDINDGPDKEGKLKNIHDSALKRCNKIKTIPTNAMQNSIQDYFVNKNSQIEFD